MSEHINKQDQPMGTWKSIPTTQNVNTSQLKTLPSADGRDYSFMNMVNGVPVQRKAFQAPHPFQMRAKRDKKKAVQKKSKPNGLPAEVQAKMENAMGHDFSNVNIIQNSASATEVGALAYAQGNDVHFAPGQFKPNTTGGQELIGHELAHVVQQREGRVKPTKVLGKGMAVNDDAGLEREADLVGRRAARGEGINQNKLSNNTSQLKQTIITQLKNDKESNFGKFIPEKYAKSTDGKKLHATIKFEPNEKVDATKIGFTQAIRKNINGNNVAIDPNAKTRMVESGTAEGFRIDRLSKKNTPIYGASDLKGSGGLDKTPQTDNTKGVPTELNPDKKRNAKYDLGHRYIDKGVEKKKDAGIYDGPTITNSTMVEFESTVVALDGNQKGNYYGSVKWGYTMDEKGIFNLMDFDLVSQGMPSNNFLAAAKLWNNSKARGTYFALKDKVEVKKLSASSVILCILSKGDEVTQIKPYKIGGESHISANIISGTNKGKSGYININDLSDKGDGKETIDLPYKEVYIVDSIVTLNNLEDNTCIELPSCTRVIISDSSKLNCSSSEDEMAGQVKIEVVDGTLIGQKGWVNFSDVSKEE